MIRLAELKTTGVFNAAGPSQKQTVKELVEEAATAFEVENTFIQVNDYEFLKENGVHYIVPWIMPKGKNFASALVNHQKAKENGLTFRPLKNSMTDIHNWWYSDSVSQEQRDEVEQNEKGFLYREQEIIDVWKKRNEMASYR